MYAGIAYVFFAVFNSCICKIIW